MKSPSNPLIILLMNFQFLEACGITGVLSVFLGSLFVFFSMILTYSFRQVGLKKYLIIHGGFVAVIFAISAAISNTGQDADSMAICSSAPLKMLYWIPAVIMVAFAINFFLKKKARI